MLHVRLSYVIKVLLTYLLTYLHVPIKISLPGCFAYSLMTLIMSEASLAHLCSRLYHSHLDIILEIVILETASLYAYGKPF